VRIALLGMGRLGRTLAPALERAGHEVLRWRRGDPFPTADIRWLTVRDDAVAGLAAALPPGGVVLHASGALGCEVLRPHYPAGSLHPLMTFPGPEVTSPPLAGLPAAVAGDPDARQAAQALCVSLGLVPFEVPGDRRLYHAACTIAGNLPTLLLVEAARLLAVAGVTEEEPLRLLLPLARAALENVDRVGAARALTGPLARGDDATLRAHVEALAGHDAPLAQIYAALCARAARDRVPDPGRP